MTIIAAVDASSAAHRVVERALEFAQTGDDLHVIHVFQPPSTIYPVEGIYITDDEEFERVEYEMVWKEVESVIAEAPVPVEKVELRGYPASTIADYARESNASLIVVGTRGRGGFASLVLGSTSQALIHDAPCDVLVVKTRSD